CTSGHDRRCDRSSVRACISPAGAGRSSKQLPFRKQMQQENAMKLKKMIVAAGLLGVLSVAPLSFADSELAVAIKNGEADLVRSLIGSTIDVNAPERDGTLPLQWAVYHENPDI